MNAPVGYFEQSMTDYFNLQPSSVKGSCNDATFYHKRYLYNMIYSVYNFNLPKNWAKNYFRFWLFHYGSIAAAYTSELGWICSPYGIDKIDYQYQPKSIIITNQDLKESKICAIGINAQIIRIFDDFFGLDDLVTDYAQKLAQIDKCVNINMMNANVTKCFGAEDKKQAEDIKIAYDKATQGNPMVVMNKSLVQGKGLVNLFGDVKGDMIVDELLTAKRRIINEFLTKIGIKNANYDKKERLNSQEVEQNNDETKSIVTVIYENLTECFDKLRVLGLDCSVTLNYDYMERTVKEYE